MSGESRGRKRVFGGFEVVFDAAYLAFGLLLGAHLIRTAAGGARLLSGIMAVSLAGGDAFHLVPRILAVLTGDEFRLRKALGFGKLATSVSMTAFYVLLWHLGLLLASPAPHRSLTYLFYALAGLRVALCLPRQNRWFDEKPPVSWGVLRNIPFALLGGMAAWLFAARVGVPALAPMPLAIALSFLFYIPVVLWSNKHPKIGMLMLPKTLAYVWMLVLCARAISN